MKVKNIQELAIRMGLITVEDMCQYTIQQLVVKIANKVNELVDEVWRFESDVQEVLKTQNENIQYLLDEGLYLEVGNIFDEWVQDGTFDTLINETALKKVNDRMDEMNAQLVHIENKTATKYELDVERNRIDNIVKNQGGSVNDLELQDIRCGYNGIIYESAGTAVRTQLKGMVSTNETTLKTGLYSFNHIGMWSSGGINESTGVDIEDATRLRSDFIPENVEYCETLEGYEMVIFTYKRSDGSFFGIDNFDGITYRTSYHFKHDLKYRIVLKKTSNEEIALDEFNNIILLNDNITMYSPSEILKKQQDLEYRPNIELEPGSIDSKTGIVVDADFRARTVDYLKVKKGYKVKLIDGRYVMVIYFYDRKNRDYKYLEDTFETYGFLTEYEFEEECYIKIVFVKALNSEIDFSIEDISNYFVTNFTNLKNNEDKKFTFDIANNGSVAEPKLFNGAVFENNKITLNNCSGVGSAIYYPEDITFLPPGTKIEVVATIAFNDFSIANLVDVVDMKFKVIRNGSTISISADDYVLQFGVQRFYEKSKKLICKIDYTIQNGDEEIIPIINVINRNSVEKMEIEIESIELRVDKNDMISINKYNKNKNSLPSTIIVAAHNSSARNKAIADFVCDGINDEVEIQKAIDTFDTASGRVILCNGNYYIDSLYDSGNDQCGKYGLYISKPENNHNVIIEGISRPNRKFSTEVGISPTIFLRDEVYNSLGDDEIVTILGVLPSDIDNLTKTYPNINLTIKNLAINIPGNKKAITLISGEYASNMQVDYFLGSIAGNSNYQDENNDAVSTTPNEKCIGLRLLPGWNFGTGFRIDNCFIWGMNVAYDIGGEHLIMCDCGCRLCNISYRFNGYENERAMSHPNTLINCCEESCLSSLHFCKSSTNQSVNLIDYNMEIRPTEGRWGRKVKAIEEVPGSFRGSITYSANYEDYINRDDIELWEKGSGLNIKTVNLNHKQSGTTQERPSHPNLNQQYFDTTLNKMIIYVEDKWVDFLGNQV